MDSFNVSLENTWDLNTEYSLFIYTYGINGSNVDITDLKISIYGNVSLEESDLYRKDVGIYFKNYIINASNSTSFMINVTAYDGSKVLELTRNVSVSQKSSLESVYETTKKYLYNTYDKFINNIQEFWLVWVIVIMVMLTVIVFIDMFLKDRKKNNEN